MKEWIVEQAIRRTVMVQTVTKTTTTLRVSIRDLLVLAGVATEADLEKAQKVEIYSECFSGCCIHGVELDNSLTLRLTTAISEPEVDQQ